MKRIRSLSGEMAARISAIDWQHSGLGPIDAWPHSLITALGMILGSRFPMQLLWGPDYLHFYNDAYIPIAHDKHPAALAAPGAAIWPEVWDVVHPLLAGVRATGQATWADDMQLILTRDGRPEECYFTFSYGPIWGDAAVEGVFIAVTETTRRVIAARRLHTGRDLATAIAGLRVEGEVCQRAAEALAQNPADLPFALLYVGRPVSDGLELVGAAQLAPGHAAAPAQTTVGGGPWPFAQALATERAVLVETLPAALGPLPGGPWGAPATAAMVLPLRAKGEFAPLGYVVAGLSPRLHLDDGYRDFLERVAGQVADQLAAARAYAVSQAAVQLRDDFLSVAAHELKNPLAPLIGRLQLLERRLHRDSVDVQHIQAVSRATADARRLVEQIDTLLDISRMRIGQFSLTRARFDLAALARQAVDELAPTLDRHLIHLTTPTMPALVDGDARRMEQVLRNLLSNAVKYSPRGGAITVSVTMAEGQVRLAVHDQGIGIPEEARAQLFTRYYRAENAEKQRSGGLGIGLFVVHEIVRLHGGQIELQSTLGAGSTFTVVLPLADRAPPPDAELGAASDR